MLIKHRLCFAGWIVAVVFCACGDESDTSDRADAECGNQANCVDASDTDTDTDMGLDSGLNDVCPGTRECEQTSDCEDGDGVPQVCGSGCCRADAEVPQPCSRQDQPCRNQRSSTAEFFCDTTENRCLTRCTVETFAADPDQFCPPETLCRSAEITTVLRDVASLQLLDGACFHSECSSNFDADGQWDPSACEGQPARYDGGSDCNAFGRCICESFPNQAGVCRVVGIQTLGRSCSYAGGSSSCRSGFTCVDSICVSVCDVDSGSCDPTPDSCPAGSDCRCEPIGYRAAGDSDGICGLSCTPFSKGECPDGSSCRPALAGRQGSLNNWFCLTDRWTGIPAGEPDQECSALKRQSETCSEGLVCADFTGSEEYATCAPLCSLEPGQVASSSSCAGDAEVCLRYRRTELGLCLTLCDPYSSPSQPRQCPDESDCVQVGRTMPEEPTPASCFRGTDRATVDQPCLPLGIDRSDNCAGTLVCAAEPGRQTYSCRPACDPHNPGTACPDGTVCGGEHALRPDGAGACVVSPANLPVGAACDNLLGPCSDHGSVCLDVLDGSRQCVQICRKSVASDCAADEACVNILQSAADYDPTAGVCLRVTSTP